MKFLIKVIVISHLLCYALTRPEEKWKRASDVEDDKEDEREDADGRRRASFAQPTGSLAFVQAQNINVEAGIKPRTGKSDSPFVYNSRIVENGNSEVGPKEPERSPYSRNFTDEKPVNKRATTRPDTVTPSTLDPGLGSRTTKKKPKERSTRPTTSSYTRPATTSTTTTTESTPRPDPPYFITPKTTRNPEPTVVHLPPVRLPQTDISAPEVVIPKLIPETAMTSSSPICVQNVTLTSLAQIITSPGWTRGEKYPRNANCRWFLQASVSSFNTREIAIVIKIRHLEIEDQAGCPYDYLEIKGHKKLCGFIKDKQVTVNGSQAELTFRSDSNYEDRGFELEISAVIPGCISHLTMSNDGVITSPSFPNNYPDSTDCWTLLSVADNARTSGDNVSIVLTFEVLNLEPDEQCAYDYVEVFEVVPSSVKPGRSLGKFCEMQQETSEDKRLGSTDPTPDPRLSTKPDKVINPSFTIRSTGPQLMLHFHSDQLLNFRGYKASYSLDKSLQRSSGSGCGWQADFDKRVISSPGYPAQYPPNKDCSMVLTAPTESHKIALIFESFQMEVDNNCNFDRLEIYELVHKSGNSRAMLYPNSPPQSNAYPSNVDPMVQESAPSKVLCGRKNKKFKHLSSGPRIKLRFISDDFGEYSGFTATYTFIKSNSDSSANNDNPGVSNDVFTVRPQNASVMVGASHMLECVPRSYSSSNNVSITWFKNNHILTEGLNEDNTRLLISEFSRINSGRYICKYGSHISEAWLEPKSSSCTILFRKRPRGMTLSEGEFTILECNAVMTPSTGHLSVTWLKDGQRVTNGSRMEQLKNGFLIINGVRSEDSGYYSCHVRSEDEPKCFSQAIARLVVNVRENIEKICGQPSAGKPSKQKPSVDEHGKIVGGADSQKGAFPWQVMFWDINRKSFCGGALLNERWVATAAHCFSPTSGQPPPPDSQIAVRLGKYDQRESEIEEVNTKIMEVIKHPGYNPSTYDNDLALIRLKDHITFTDYIKPICLGPSKEAIDETFFDTQRSYRMGHVTGWGQLKESGPQPRFLQEIRMPIVQPQKCIESTTFKVTNNMFCAGYAQEVIGDACKGDSGGPFVGQSQNRWYLLGIVSWGEGCGRSGKYGFYTKVNNYNEWMKAIMKL